MGLRFRKILKLFPGVRLNMSLGGPSLSLGKKGASFNIGRKGTKATVGLPGSGISYSEQASYKKTGAGRAGLHWLLLLAIIAIWAIAYFAKL